MSGAHHTIIGLPRSGKTTFLAALWHLIDAGEVPTSLVLDSLVGNHEHLNEIVESWRRCLEVPRTSLAKETTVSIHFRASASDRTLALTFPDLSGESFDRQVERRYCSKQYVDGLTGEGGVMLFITADKPSDGLTILEVNSVLNEAHTEEPRDQLREWGPELVPPQVRLVELLQFVQRPPFEQRRRRLAVIVSAWDVVLTPQPSPEAWLAKELPLLHQFLECNGDNWDVRVYGVSAQGGNVRGAEREALLNLTPSQRIRCVGPSAGPHDLTSPILWLNDGD